MSSSRLADLTTSFITIASTLIVIKVQLPYDATLESLAQNWSMFLAGIDSFMIILLLWYNHVREIRKLNFVSFPVLFLSTFWVLGLLLLPYATGWIANYPSRPVPNFVYLGILSFCYLFFELIHWQIYREGAMSKESLIYSFKLRIPMYLMMIFAFLIVWFWPLWGLGCVLMIVLYNTGYLFYITRHEKSHS